MWRSETNVQGSLLSCYHLDVGDQTRVLELDRKGCAILLALAKHFLKRSLLVIKLYLWIFRLENKLNRRLWKVIRALEIVIDVERWPGCGWCLCDNHRRQAVVLRGMAALGPGGPWWCILLGRSLRALLVQGLSRRRHRLNIVWRSSEAHG